jgi:hypothetical protein
MSNSMVAAAVIVGASILAHSWLNKAPIYQLSAAGNDGQTVWRVDGRNGRISMCGTAMDGATFSQVQAQNKPSPEAQAKIVEDFERVRMLAEPRCTQWTSD